MNAFRKSDTLALTNAVGAAGPAAPQTWAPTENRRDESGFWRTLFGVAVDRSTWGALLYMILALGTGIAFFTIVVTGLSLSAGLMVLIVGIPFFVAFLALVRGLSFLEGRLVEGLLGTKIPGRPWSVPHGLGFFQRIWFWFKDRRTWTAMAYMLLQLPLGIFYFTVAVAGFAGGAWLVVLPFMQWIGGHTYIHYWDNSEFLFGTWQLPLLFIAGVLVLLAWMHLVRAIGRGHAAYAKAMLGPVSSELE